MISMYAEYSGRTLYVALSTDTIDGAKNGDTLYEMDTGKRYVYNESNDAWDEQPEEGGGGGGGGTETALVKVRNRRTGSLTITYLTGVGNLPGLFGNQQSLSQNGLASFPNMALQDGDSLCAAVSLLPTLHTTALI